MLWSMMRLIFKTSSVTPDFFYVFNLILSFSTCSESFEKICAWELLGANILNYKHMYMIKEKKEKFDKAWFKRRILHAPNQILILPHPSLRHKGIT